MSSKNIHNKLLQHNSYYFNILNNGLVYKKRKTQLPSPRLLYCAINLTPQV